MTEQYPSINYSNLPLYMVIAIWGRRNNQLLTTKDVARSFSLSQQQASDIINYIHREGAKYIKSEKIFIFCVVNGIKTKVRALKILDVAIRPLPIKPDKLRQQNFSEQKSLPSVKRNSPEKKDDIKAIRQWICRRQIGETYLNRPRNLGG
ncbi:CaiF/GrlA family transcriptional regulator (plasmid) [Escherichia albertii]|uniref:CaiF/GrlA family transcriptional regulator n=1 Tax=Escherichia albertii TaxID=208962 RepID=UPI002360994D|nr:CaiF/GrlA family transcriptional regulator [Escherichia albertii]WDB54782.1 CaiF/GrlA family transcriptional regulator [Escherichia albertii]